MKEIVNILPFIYNLQISNSIADNSSRSIFAVQQDLIVRPYEAKLYERPDAKPVKVDLISFFPVNFYLYYNLSKFCYNFVSRMSVLRVFEPTKSGLTYLKVHKSLIVSMI